jgi:hypothetical protein
MARLLLVRAKGGIGAPPLPLDAAIEEAERATMGPGDTIEGGRTASEDG